MFAICKSIVHNVEWRNFIDDQEKQIYMCVLKSTIEAKKFVKFIALWNVIISERLVHGRMAHFFTFYVNELKGDFHFLILSKLNCSYISLMQKSIYNI